MHTIVILIVGNAMYNNVVYIRKIVYVRVQYHGSYVFSIFCENVYRASIIS